MNNICEKWSEFKIDFLFDIYTGGDLILYNIDSGDIPIITHSKKNQGIEYYSQKISDRRIFNHKRSLSLADRGNFISFVQNEDFYIGTRVKALVLKDEHIYCNKNILLFLATMINYESFRFSYGRNATDRLGDLYIRLPEKNNLPDWDFMDNYINSRMEDIISNINNDFIDNSESEIGIEKHLNKFENVNLVEYLDLSSTKDQIDKINLDINSEPKIYPYITRTGKNNGIDCYIGAQVGKKINKGNCIVIGLDTQTLSYQENEFYTGQNIQILRHDNLNKYNALFIITIMKMELYKYGWSRGLTLERLRKFTCNLPIKGNTLDWDFMETYICSTTYSKFI